MKHYRNSNSFPLRKMHLEMWYAKLNALNLELISWMWLSQDECHLYYRALYTGFGDRQNAQHPVDHFELWMNFWSLIFQRCVNCELAVLDTYECMMHVHVIPDPCRQVIVCQIGSDPIVAHDGNFRECQALWQCFIQWHVKIVSVVWQIIYSIVKCGNKYHSVHHVSFTAYMM